MASGSAPGAEDLEERVSRLCERFPVVSAERVHQVLRDHGGHAGYAAAELRALSTDTIKPVDAEDSEHVAILLSNQTIFKQTCRAHFKKFDLNRNGTLEWDEVLALTNHLCHYMGVEQPGERSLQAFFAGSDTNHDGVLTEREFPKFFESFLRYAFFMQHRKLVGTWRIRSSDSSDNSSSEFTILLGKDYRLYYRSARGGSQSTQVSQGRQEYAHGTLELHEGSLQADLKVGLRDSEKRGHENLRGHENFVGGVQLRSPEGLADKVIVNFRRDPEAFWGNDITAVRKKDLEDDRFSVLGVKNSGVKGCHHRQSPKSGMMSLSPKSGMMWSQSSPDLSVR